MIYNRFFAIDFSQTWMIHQFLLRKRNVTFRSVTKFEYQCWTHLCDIVNNHVKQAAAPTQVTMERQQQQTAKKKRNKKIKKNSIKIFLKDKEYVLITFCKFDTFSKGKRDISYSVLSVTFFHKFFSLFFSSKFFLFSLGFGFLPGEKKIDKKAVVN